MDLQDIKQVSCPDCGCTDVVSERRENCHINGHWNEYKKFSCGFEYHFSPNHMKALKERECTKSSTFVAREEKRKEAHRKLKNYINKLDVDDKYKEKLQRDVYNYSYCGDE